MGKDRETRTDNAVFLGNPTERMLVGELSVVTATNTVFTSNGCGWRQLAVSVNTSYSGCSSPSLSAYMTSHRLEMRRRSDAKPCSIKGKGYWNLKVTLYVVPTCVSHFAVLLTLQKSMIFVKLSWNTLMEQILEFCELLTPKLHFFKYVINLVNFEAKHVIFLSRHSRRTKT